MFKIDIKKFQKEIIGDVILENLIPQSGFGKIRTGDSGFRTRMVERRDEMRSDSAKESKRLNFGSTTHPLTSSREKARIYGKTTPMYFEKASVEAGMNLLMAHDDLNDVYGRTLPEERTILDVIRDEYMKNGF